MTVPLAQAYTGLLADPPGNPKSVPAWNPSSPGPKGLVTIRPVPSGQYLAIRPTPRACSHRRPSRQWVTRTSGASSRPGRLETQPEPGATARTVRLANGH